MVAKKQVPEAAPAKKVPAKKQVAQAPAEPAKKGRAKKSEEEKSAERAAKVAEFNQRKAELNELAAQIVELRDGQGMQWSKICEEVGIASVGRVQLMYFKATVTPKERISKPVEELGPIVVRLRDDEKLSWGKIMARVGLTEGKVRQLYRDASGQDDKGNRIGKGGRWPLGQEPPEGTKASQKKAGATVTKISEDFGELDFKALNKRLTGQTVTHRMPTSGKVKELKVRSVKALKDGVVSLVDDATGNARSIVLENIISATKKRQVRVAENA